MCRSCMYDIRWHCFHSILLLRIHQNSMEVAAKCMEQAFMFASENLDSIGLPLVQLLGKNMR